MSSGAPTLYLVPTGLVTETREERGVFRDRLAPAGYAGYTAVNKDGLLVAHIVVRQELVSEACEQDCVENLWEMIDQHEGRKPPVQLA